MALSSMPRRPSRRKKEKYPAILKAAIKTFARKGFFNSKVADVAREAGIADGTVYLYFRNKEDILISIFNHIMDEAIAEGRKALVGITDPKARLKRVAHLHLDRLGRDRNLAVVFQVELRQSTKFIKQFSATKVKDYLGIIRTILLDGQKSGCFRRAIDPKLAAMIFFGALDEMATHWILSRRKYKLAARADHVVDLFFQGICNAEA